jgi:hypothetical protein
MMDYQYVFFKASFFGYFQILCMFVQRLLKKKTLVYGLSLYASVLKQSHSMTNNLIKAKAIEALCKNCNVI